MRFKTHGSSKISSKTHGFRQLVAKIANHCHTVTRNVFEKKKKRNEKKTTDEQHSFIGN